ncbi:MAG: hypothetical protein KAQ75_05870 [Bacteroidales bacterium]|nr:hypothetical protein [Bacteroidales bacterium]
MYTKYEIIQDINFLIEDIEEIHPEPYHSIEKAEFLKRIELIERKQ